MYNSICGIGNTVMQNNNSSGSSDGNVEMYSKYKTKQRSSHAVKFIAEPNCDTCSHDIAFLVNYGNIDHGIFKVGTELNLMP